MLIDIKKIGPHGLRLKDSTTLDNQLLIEEDSTFLEPVEYAVLFSREGQLIKLRGQVRTLLSLPCVRCLEQTQFRVDTSFTLMLSPVKLIDPSHTELNPEEMEVDFFEGDQIDLGKILLEQINLSVPNKTTCDPNCKGICSHCGTNLNKEKCRCENTYEENDVNLLFSKLKR